MRRVVIFGAGALARESLAVLRRLQAAGTAIDCLGFLVDAPAWTGDRLAGLPVFDDPATFIGSPDVAFCVAVGDPAGKAAIVARLDRLGAPYASLIDPLVWIGERSRVGEGTIAFGHVSVSVDCSLGRHVLINPGCSIAHDNRLEDFVSLSPGVHLAGYVTCRAGAFLGTGAIALPRVTVGCGATVGAGAVLVRDVPDGLTVAGNPARALAPRTPV